MDIIQEDLITFTTAEAQQDERALSNERLEFFSTHKDDKWFKNKYHPVDSVIQKKKQNLALKKRFDIFNEFLANGKIDSVSVDTNNLDHLVRLLDSVIIKLQGGTDLDLTVFNPTETLKTQQEPKLKKKETNKKKNGEVDSDKNNGDETNKIDKSAVINTEEMSNVWKGRVWSVNGITNNFQVACNDLELCEDIIDAFDYRSDLAESIVGEHPVLDKVYNTVLINTIKESPEEQILLGESVSFKSIVITETLKQLLKTLDRMILYLRIVHSIDFYKYIGYAYEDDMPSGRSVIHVRGPQTRDSPTQQEITDYCNLSQFDATCLAHTTFTLTESEITRLGAVDVEKSIDIFIKNCIKRKSHDKWLCKMSGKIFKSREDVRENIIKNYSDLLDNMALELKYFNNFIRDPNRPKQKPYYSYPSANRYQMSGQPSI